MPLRLIPAGVYMVDEKMQQTLQNRREQIERTAGSNPFFHRHVTQRGRKQEERNTTEMNFDLRSFGLQGGVR